MLLSQNIAVISVFLAQAANKAVTTLIKTIPSNMLSMAKSGLATLNTVGGGKQTIVITAPKGAAGALGASAQGKILSAMPKLGAGGNTQFIVVSSQPGGGTTHVTLPSSVASSIVGKFQ